MSLDRMTDPCVPVDLIADGVLWLVNASVFHPRGYALALDPADGSLTLRGDGTEPWVYGEGIDIDKRFDQVRALFERARRENSKEGQ